MNQDQYKQWVSELPTLTQAQLKDLDQRIRLLSNTAHKEHNGKSEFAGRVLQAICNTLKKQGVDCPSVTTLKKSAAYVGCKGKCDDLSIFFDKISKSKLVQDRILSEAIELLYYDLLQWGVAVSAHTILNQIHRIPATLNRAFPGYSQSGVLQKLVG